MFRLRVPYNFAWRPGKVRRKDDRPTRATSRRVLQTTLETVAPPSAMPNKVTNPELLHERRARRKLASTTRQAAMNATPAEFMQLRALIEATHTGSVTVEDARATIEELRAAQRARNAWPPEPDTHDPDECTDMVCTEPACIARNVNRPPVGDGTASPFRKAA